MLLSKHHRFLFIHVPKTAGTSISMALKPYLPPDHIGRIIRRTPTQVRRHPLLRRFHPHVTAAEARALLPEHTYGSVFKFAFVRNPWDRQVSLYHYILSTPDHYRHTAVRDLGSFPAFVRQWVETDQRTQHHWFSDAKGHLLVDFVGRFEALEKDFATACDRAGVKAELPRLNVSERSSYRKYYDSDTRRLIETHFRSDIEAFGYEF